MGKLKALTVSIILMLVLSLAGPSFDVSARPQAQVAPALGVLATYSVLAHTGVTNSGPTVVSGDVGSDGSTIGGGITIGLPGTIRTPADALSAQNAATVAAVSGANSLESQGPGTTLASSELAGRTLTHGVYTVPGVSLLSGGVVTLDGPGVYIFLTGGLTATGTVNLINGADACNVFWRDSSSVAINNSGASGSFVGTIIALTSITFNTGAKLVGRAIAQNGNVTLLSNTITGPTCGTNISTALIPSGPITAGGTAHDTATLTGTNSSTATGFVTYNVYSDAGCTNLVQSSGPFTVVGGSLPNSAVLTFPTIGTFYWRATYNPSGNLYNAASTSACGDEVLTVVAQPTPTRTPATVPGSTSTPGPGTLPGTGFAPQHVSLLSAQPAQKAYAELGDLWLEIPRLGVQMPIVGVPQTDGEWDVSWLGNDAGWLNGTAFPTWAGNSVLTGHVYNADGNPGPFVHLNWMWWGDQVVVHAWGAQYVYEVRQVYQVTPGSISTVIKHEQLPWMTLVTCRGYDEASNSYKYRVVVRAVLVEVK